MSNDEDGDYDETDYREVGDAFAEKAEEAASQTNGGDQLAGVTYALLAIHSELRHNDLGTKIETLTEGLLLWQKERDKTESRIAAAIEQNPGPSQSRWGH